MIRLFSCLLLLSCCGCGGPRVLDDRELSLDIGEIKTIVLDSSSGEQTLTVVATSPGAPIHLHVYLPEHEEAIERKITLGKPPENLLASQESAEEISVRAVVPAHKEMVVRLQPAGRIAAVVHLTISR